MCIFRTKCSFLLFCSCSCVYFDFRCSRKTLNFRKLKNPCFGREVAFPRTSRWSIPRFASGIDGRNFLCRPGRRAAASYAAPAPAAKTAPAPLVSTSRQHQPHHTWRQLQPGMLSQRLLSITSRQRQPYHTRGQPQPCALGLVVGYVTPAPYHTRRQLQPCTLSVCAVPVTTATAPAKVLFSRWPLFPLPLQQWCPRGTVGGPHLCFLAGVHFGEWRPQFVFL